MNYTRSICDGCFISLLFTAGVYRECVLEELLKPDQDVHVSFRRIGRAVFLATRGNQSPVWRRCLAHCLKLAKSFLPKANFVVTQDAITQNTRFLFV